jgi:hypothetical protein
MAIGILVLSESQPALPGNLSLRLVLDGQLPHHVFTQYTPKDCARPFFKVPQEAKGR